MRLNYRVKSLPLGLILFATAFAQAGDYALETSFLGGAGSTTTNSAYSLTSSWRQATQTSISSGGDFVNSSGFLAQVAEIDTGISSSAFSIAFFTYHQAPALARITVQTVPGVKYTIQFSDHLNASSSDFRPFSNTTNGIGCYIETNVNASEFTFLDDFTEATSGAVSASSRRFYRVVQSR